MRFQIKGALAILAAGYCLLLPSFARASGKDFDLTIRRVFDGVNYGARVLPLEITIQNKGADATGGVLVSSADFEMNYPVQLPRGSKKSFFSYVSGNNFFEPVQVSLDTDQGHTSAQFRIDAGMGGNAPIALITDSTGGMSFLRMNNGKFEGTSDLYAKAGRLPDRAAGYFGIGAVILGEGAERITDIELQALKSYILTGGTVVFIGGASAPVLRDPRWQSLLPVRDFRASTVTGSGVLSRLAGAPLPSNSFSVQAGHLVPGATQKSDGDFPMIAYRRFGLGKTAFFAFNPFEAPLNKWEGRGPLFMRTLNPSGVLQAEQVMSLGRSFDNGATVYARSYSGTIYPPGSAGVDDASDPFSAEMPPTSTVVWILLACFVLVVPVNLLVLKKFNRGEWAWGTAPLISLLFAGIFFRFASNLYGAQKSTATEGLLVVDNQLGAAYFEGKTQLFFPTGGRYDLGLQNVETITPIQDQNSGGGFSGGTSHVMEDLGAIDDGEVKAPSMSVPNLSFHQFSFDQRVTGQPWLDANVNIDESGARISRGTVTNRTLYPIKDAKILYDGMSFWVGEIKPGETKDVKSSSSGGEAPNTDQYGGYIFGLGQSLQQYTGSGRYVLMGTVEGFRPGPQIGKQVEKYSKINIAEFFTNGPPSLHAERWPLPADSGRSSFVDVGFFSPIADHDWATAIPAGVKYP